jgi:hypothetical protein
MAQLRHGKGVQDVVDFIVKHGGLHLRTDAA